MAKNNGSVVILIADDDIDDRMMIKDAFKERRLGNEIRFVEDGEDLTDYLLRKGKYTDGSSSPRPGLILLDLNMPKKDGREALKEIKNNPDLKSIPIVVLTTSKAQEDIYKTYNLGVNSYITKPVTFEALVNVARDVSNYWFEIVELPSSNKSMT